MSKVVSWDVEAVLVRRARRGDEEAFRRLIENHQATITSTLVACGVRSRDTAFDLSQEVALRVWRALPELRDPRAVGGWLRRVAANAARDHLRRLAARPEEPLDEDLELAGEEDPHREVTRADELRLMLEALGEIERPVAELLIASADGVSVKELSRRAGTTEGALKMRLSRARRLLRQRLAVLRADPGA